MFSGKAFSLAKLVEIHLMRADFRVPRGELILGDDHLRWTGRRNKRFRKNFRPRANSRIHLQKLGHADPLDGRLQHRRRSKACGKFRLVPPGWLRNARERRRIAEALPRSGEESPEKNHWPRPNRHDGSLSSGPSLSR